MTDENVRTPMQTIDPPTERTEEEPDGFLGLPPKRGVAAPLFLGVSEDPPSSSRPPPPARFDEDPEPEPCSCAEAAWLRRRIDKLQRVLTDVHNERSTPPYLKHAIKQACGLRVFLCCHPECPGYPYRASDLTHPDETCGAKVIRGHAAAGMDRDGTPEGTVRLVEVVIPRVRRWLEEHAHPERGSTSWDWATLKLDLRYEGDSDENDRAYYRCMLTEEIQQPEAEGSG